MDSFQSSQKRKRDEEEDFKKIFAIEVSPLPKDDEPLGSFFGQPFWHSNGDFDRLVVQCFLQMMGGNDNALMEVLSHDHNYLLAEQPEKVDMELALLGWSKKSRLACIESLESGEVDDEGAVRLQTPFAAASMMKRAVYRSIRKLDKRTQDDFTQGVVDPKAKHSIIQVALYGLAADFGNIKTHIRKKLEALKRASLESGAHVDVRSLGQGSDLLLGQKRGRCDDDEAAPSKKIRLNVDEEESGPLYVDLTNGDSDIPPELLSGKEEASATFSVFPETTTDSTLLSTLKHALLTHVAVESDDDASNAEDARAESNIDVSINGSNGGRPIRAASNTADAPNATQPASIETCVYGNEFEVNVFDPLDDIYLPQTSNPDFDDFQDSMLAQMKPETAKMLEFMNELST